MEPGRKTTRPVPLLHNLLSADLLHPRRGRGRRGRRILMSSSPSLAKLNSGEIENFHNHYRTHTIPERSLASSRYLHPPPLVW